MFTVEGVPAQPNLMQQRIAYVVGTDRAVCNFSGTGAGKTLSAILASRVIQAELTVILTANSTLVGWQEAIHGAFHGCHVAFTVDALALAPHGAPRYLILNYEKFQVAGAESMADALVSLKPDFVVLDEIQFNKERKGVRTSARRRVLHDMVQRIPTTGILAMTATPVINDLHELKALMETSLRRRLEMGTQPTQENALH